MADPLPDDTLDRLFRTARTYNHYTDQPVSETTLRAIWELVKWGPTSLNQEPARIVWCTSDEAKARLAACCAEKNAAKVLAAPVTAIIGMDLRFYDKLAKLFPAIDGVATFAGKDRVIEESAFRNSTLQGAYFIIAARMLGLGTGPMSGFDAAKVNAAFFAGTDVRANFISTLGYGDPATVRPRLPRLDFEEANTIV